MKFYNTYTFNGVTAMQVSETEVRIRGVVYNFQMPVTVLLVKALIKKVVGV